ncbi:hypothetical protein SAE02_35990 [Skermanella aerolata]|uniref:Uncharacterized protein n=1 Tax=Skermanella aerolata TaxID=393310 RepID=A0A512DSI8_9PROT|nr:hypothetical protein [Skermanella aerolata]GEO39451.1 hypothetical protein SAE02_35990 [Skermanella aerolata]
METISEIKDASKPYVINFNGFLACLMYSEAHTDFRSAILNNWNSLHEFSGKYVLLLTADVPKVKERKPRRRSMIKGNSIGYLTTFAGFSPHQTDSFNSEAREYFGVRRADMPCIVFFDDLDEPSTLSYSFRNSNDLIGDFFNIFDDCESAWSLPAAADLKNLPDYRRRKMIELESLLNRRRFLRLASRLTKNPSFSGILKIFG